MQEYNQYKSLNEKQNKLFYGWIVVVISLIIVSTLAGIRTSFGMFFKSLATEFNITRTETSSIYSAYLMISATFFLIKGWAIDRYEPKTIISLMGLFTGLSLLITSQINSLWQIYISYSLLLSFGAVGIIVMLTPVISGWFHRNRGFALGITSSGVGLGTLIVAPLAGYLISNIGWRMSYLVMGLLAFIIVIPLAMLLKRNPGEDIAMTNGLKEESSKMIGLSLIEALRTSSFWLISSIWSLFALAWGIIMTHIVPYATDLGISTVEASTILSIMSGFQIISRLAAGRASDIVGRKIPCTICAVFGTWALVWLIWSHELWMFYISAVFFGLSYGGIAVIILAMASDTFGRRSLGVITSAIYLCFSIGAAIGSSLSGYIFDTTKSYTIAFIIGAVALLFIIPLIVPIKPEINAEI